MRLTAELRASSDRRRRKRHHRPQHCWPPAPRPCLPPRCPPPRPAGCLIARPHDNGRVLPLVPPESPLRSSSSVPVPSRCPRARRNISGGLSNRCLGSVIAVPLHLRPPVLYHRPTHTSTVKLSGAALLQLYLSYVSAQTRQRPQPTAFYAA